MSESKKFPDKSERLICWGARDEYFKCLDKNKNKEELCVQFKNSFQENCPPTWVKHFLRKRRYEQFKEEYNQKGWFEEKPETES